MKLVGLSIAIIAHPGFTETLVAAPAASVRSGMILGRFEPGLIHTDVVGPYYEDLAAGHIAYIVHQNLHNFQKKIHNEEPNT
jgi:hypothetical protein